MEQLSQQIITFIPLLFTTIVVALVLFTLHWLLLGRSPELGNERKLPRQLIMLGMSLIGAIVIALALPVSDSTRNQVIALISLLVSGVIAFSSTTVTSNFMAGVMLRNTKPFRVGDFIRIGEHFGRVAERGLLDTEIQTEHRELVSLPNTYLISKPIEVVRSSGAIISATLSLGYDLHHGQVEAYLIQAAEETGLEEPFCQIMELGDYSITYRVSGLLTEVKSLLTTRSNLRRKILDTLHENGVEIVSPAFMNQRPMPEKTKVLPTSVIRTTSTESFKAEEIVFDKAEEAEEREEKKLLLQTEVKELESEVKGLSGDEKKRVTVIIAEKKDQLSELVKSEKEKDAEQQVSIDISGREN